MGMSARSNFTGNRTPSVCQSALAAQAESREPFPRSQQPQNDPRSRWLLRYNLAKPERRLLRALSKKDRLVVFEELEKISLEGGVLKGRTVQELLMRRYGQCDYACASKGCHGTPGICIGEVLAGILAKEAGK